MSSKAMYLIGMLVVLFLANLAMLAGMTNWPQRTREGFATAMAAGHVKPGQMAKPSTAEAMDNIPPFTGLTKGHGSAVQGVAYRAGSVPSINNREFFEDMLVSAGGSAFATAPMGSYDGLNLAAGLPPAAQGFRANHPNEPLAGPPVEIGPDNLFYFKNNQCKPECCGATLSCDGGCVCSTPDQRNFINTRGGNRLSGDF
jgi:hypothetical protein